MTATVSIAGLPLFPLNTVLFPGGLLPLRIFEQRYMTMAKDCLRRSSPFGVCLIREGREVGTPALPAEVGCLARIRDWDMQQLGMLNVIAAGEQRFRMRTRRTQEDGLLRADVDLLDAETDSAIPDAYEEAPRVLRAALDSLGARGAPADPRASLTEPRYDSAVWVASRLAELLPLPMAAKQTLLELSDGLERLARVHEALQRAGLAR